TNNLWDGLANDNWTAYGIMVEGTGECESYAEAFQTLCLKMGINCTGITGTADGGGHKWNAVELDGEWYACDVTFDDPLGGDPNGTYHRYFNLTTKEMAADHSTAGSDFPGPDCTGTKYSFTNYFDK
ncbi:MAG: transglutaminase, partial [Oscillospiraceae bacterium]|nr:transglutaminase [Oscillospiraceae bacterium]